MRNGHKVPDIPEEVRPTKPPVPVSRRLRIFKLISRRRGY